MFAELGAHPERRHLVAAPRIAFLIAHRGSGDVFPEHSLPAYEGALAWGAPAIEVSVVRTSDGVLFCQHDLDFKRTTTIQGLASQATWASLDGVRIEIPRLGPRWLGDGRPGLARLDTVLTRLGHKTVVVLEAKDPEAFEPMLALVAELGVQSSVVCKLHQSSRRIPRARATGLPIFCYFGAPDEVTANRLAEIGAPSTASRTCSSSRPATGRIRCPTHWSQRRSAPAYRCASFPCTVAARSTTSRCGAYRASSRRAMAMSPARSRR